MDRVLIADLKKYTDKKVLLKGWVVTRRDHGKLIFLDLRDRSEDVQVVILPGSSLYEMKDKIRNGTVLRLNGLVKERPEKMRNEAQALGSLEVEGIEGEIYSMPVEPLPFGMDDDLSDLKLETLLDHRPITLRNKKIKAIFKIYHTIVDTYSSCLRKQGFTEIKTSKIVGGATEGGSNVFTLDYFERKAYLAQSPQFYKQMMAGVYERVFEVGPVYRAEHHFTSRHVNEYTSLDAEMAFIDSENDVMDMLENVIKAVFADVKEKNVSELSMFDATGISTPDEIPKIPLEEALKIIKDTHGKETDGFDIDPEGEKLIAEYVKEKFDSDFLFLTKYPVDIRPFYHMTYPEAPRVTRSFDLLYRGLELATGAQRIHDHAVLIQSMKDHSLNPLDFENYLEAFKFGMPPHGGWGMSGERILQKMLDLKNIREAILFPRDVKRLNP